MLPEEVGVGDKEDVPHDGARSKQATIKHEVKTDDVQGERQDKQGGKMFALRPQTDGRNDEYDGHHEGDILRIHQNLDILKRLIGIVEVASRGREHAGRAKNRRDKHEGEQHFQDDIEDFLEFHRVFIMDRIIVRLAFVKLHFDSMYE